MKLTLNVSLAGKTAVITVAGGVICGCMAKVLAEAGAKVRWQSAAMCCLRRV